MRARGGARSSGANGGRIGRRNLGPSEQICCGRVWLPHRCGPLHYYHYSLFSFFFDSHQKKTTCQNWKVKQTRSAGVLCYRRMKERAKKQWERERVRGGSNLSFSSSQTLSKKHRVLSRARFRQRLGWGCSLRNDDNVLRLIWNFQCVCFYIRLRLLLLLLTMCGFKGSFVGGRPSLLGVVATLSSV